MPSKQGTFNVKTTKLKHFVPPLIIFLFLFILPSSQIVASGLGLRHHRRREAATGDEQQEQQQRAATPAVFRYQCPAGCFCVPDIVNIELLIVSCRWSRIRPRTSFAQFPRRGTKSLSIQCGGDGGGEVEEQNEEEDDGGEQPEGMLDGFDELQELRISGCSASGWLSGSDSSPTLFRSLPRLRHLHLSHLRSLRLLSPQFFAGLGPSLEQLTLAGTELEQFPQDALCDLQGLQVLNVSGNQLPSARLSLSCQFGQLIMADLSGNRIRALDRGDLAPFPALRQLALADNHMDDQLDSDAFAGVPLLQHLDLSSTGLSSLPSLPPTLLHLDLSHNKFHRNIPATVRELPALRELLLTGNAIGSATNSEEGKREPLRSASLEKLDLSWNVLRQVPVRLVANSLDSLKHLGLAGNAIARLEPGQMTNFSSLKQLDLSHNLLSGHLASGIFGGLGELQVLSLDNNTIEGLDTELFGGMGTKLHSLGMSRNLLTELPMAIGRLHRVRRMDFSSNRISKTYKFVLNKLSHLAKLDLAGNLLETVDSYVFADCAHLAEIILARNRIQSLSSDAFAKCPRLRRIDLAENKIGQLNGALAELHTLRWVNLTGNAMEELEWSQLPAELLELEANGNGMRRIGVLEAGTGEARKLRRMELKRNKLTQLSMDSFPASLEELNVSENELNQLTGGGGGGAQLKMLDLRSNQLRTIPRELYDQTVGANAPFGQLWIGDNPLECGCEMGWLRNASEGTASGAVADIGTAKCLVPLSGERKLVKNTMPSDFLCAYTQICASGCLCCQYRNCDCKSRCPPGCRCFRDHNSAINVVKCDDSAAVGADFSLRDLPMQASHVLLSGLDIPVLKSHDLLGRDRLLELHINNSGIHTIQPSALNTLPNLAALHLSGNRIKRINGEEGLHTLNIRSLDLSGNKIVEVDPKLATMAPQLETLHLADNMLEELPRYLQSPFGDQLRHVSLAGNPFRCDCAQSRRRGTTVDAAHWLDGNFARVLDPEGMQCVENVTRAKLLNDTTVLSTMLPNGEEDNDLFTMSMLEFLQQENRTICIGQIPGVFGIGGPMDVLMLFALLLSGFLILFGLLFMFIRWRKPPSSSSSDDSVTKTHLIGTTTNSHSLSSSQSPRMSAGGGSPMPLIAQMVPEDRRALLGKGFDMFVSYHKTDEKMLLQEFCRPLKSEGYALCLLHRCGHYLPYAHQYVGVNEELIQLVRSCRALVMFVTPEFIEDEWKTLQVSMSHQLRKDYQPLIIYVSEQLANRMNELPKTLGDMIRRNARMWKFWKPGFDDPFSLDELKRVLVDDENELSASHIYSEYGTIPPQVPSAMI